MSGIRHNNGKTKHSLLPSGALKKVADIFTNATISGKYPERNWEKGLSWSSVYDSLQRHLSAWHSGEDFDNESSQLHMAHAVCNALMILEYYNIHPQGDDRPQGYLSGYRIGLDIDEVLAGFVSHYLKYTEQNIPAEFWNFDPNFALNMDRFRQDKEFWLTMPVLTLPEFIPFEPTCYITARSIDSEWTKEWLFKNNFPHRPVFTISNSDPCVKVEIAKEQKLDFFVDDRFENFVEFNKAGICCFLFDAPHNQRFNVGHKRIYSLNELGKRLNNHA